MTITVFINLFKKLLLEVNAELNVAVEGKFDPTRIQEAFLLRVTYIIVKGFQTIMSNLVSRV